jgi:hypothetical protein
MAQAVFLSMAGAKGCKGKGWKRKDMVPNVSGFTIGPTSDFYPSEVPNAKWWFLLLPIPSKGVTHTMQYHLLHAHLVITK